MSKWRSKDYFNPFLQTDSEGNYVDSRAFEVGYDQCLTDLRKEGWHIVNGETVDSDIPVQCEDPYCAIEGTDKGTLIFIPDDEVEQ